MAQQHSTPTNVIRFPKGRRPRSQDDGSQPPPRSYDFYEMLGKAVALAMRRELEQHVQEYHRQQ